MKLILDPFVFWLPPDASVQPIHTEEVLKNIDSAISLTQKGCEIVSSDALWRRINQELVTRLSKHIAAQKLITRIQILQKKIRFVEPPIGTATTWGVRELFSFANLNDPEFWMTSIAQIAAYWIESGEEFSLFMRLLEGRNLKRHLAQQCVILEKTHWHVYIQSPGALGKHPITCLSSARNLEIPWTVRYDDRLPDSAPLNGLNFAPVKNWHLPETDVIRTIRAKPTWVDAYGNGWSDTNTPGNAYHWDVFLNQKKLIQKFKGDHVNITRYGTNDRGRSQGEVHH